ncbi:MAG TPA: hypothetical protein VG650_15835 [Mycobacteriales bacterium]|nr:hypothetical protein [Mycobacteriales bacterium]
MTSPLAHAPVSAIVAHQLALSEAAIVDHERRYERGRRVTSFWAMWDLRGSAGYRIATGDRNAYIRLEAFVGTARRILGVYSGVEVFKELGDAVLVRSDDLRALLETACVLASLSNLWSVPRASSGPNLETRCAVTYGLAVALDRPGAVDYVGSPLDRLARLASLQSGQDPLMLLDSEAHDRDPRLLSEYSFLTVDGPHLLDPARLKPGEPPVRYFELAADPTAMGNCRNLFQDLRTLSP